MVTAHLLLGTGLAMLAETVAAPDLLVGLDPASGGVRLSDEQGRSAVLHPIWLRERTRQAGAFDPDSGQRLFESSDLQEDLRVLSCRLEAGERLDTRFSDGHRCALSLEAIRRELGWLSDPEAPPEPVPWTAALAEWPRAEWSELNSPEPLRAFLAEFHRYGFGLLHDTPRTPGTLKEIAKRFGFLRDTNFGAIFEVCFKPKPIDLAYTGLALSAHCDNPYRRPVPGIQMLHCLENNVEGGLSTLVDGFAIAGQLAAEAPQQLEILERTAVRFRYESRNAIMEDSGPLIERDLGGRLRRVRLSTRLDFVPPLAAATLDLFYRGRRRLQHLAADPAFEIRFRLEPGMLVMMDNHRVLHGRTAFNHTRGQRHLQGCYIDHDGPDMLYRMLARDGTILAVQRDLA
jgi:gamma-butyrobetaine dioxygenase